KLLSIGITQRTPERAGVMSSALCEEAMPRTEQNPLNKRPRRRTRRQVACLNSCRPTSSEIDNRSPPAQAPLRFALLPEASAVPRRKPVPHPHHWSCELQALGHTLRLMAYVRPPHAAPHLLFSTVAQSLG